jgi:hypothetical protein
LTINVAASNYTIVASGGVLKAATSHAFSVTPAAAAKLVMAKQPPSSVAAGTGFGVTLWIEDQFGNLVTNYSGSVTIALDLNPGGSTLGGLLTVNVVQGVATFTGLTLDKPGQGYRLRATSTGLSDATSILFNVT